MKHMGISLAVLAGALCFCFTGCSSILLQQKETVIRQYLLRDTPLGMEKANVMNYIENKGWQTCRDGTPASRTPLRTGADSVIVAWLGTPVISVESVQIQASVFATWIFNERASLKDIYVYREIMLPAF